MVCIWYAHLLHILAQESPGLLAAGLQAGPGLQDQAEPLDGLLLDCQVGGEHVAVADSGGIPHSVLQDPAAEDVGQGVWLTAARERTLLI